MSKTMRRAVIILIAISVVVYTIQILIFDDPDTTVFYFLQDVAFMPLTIALATLLVGEILSAKEKKERADSTKMLTSTFFTEVGNELIRVMIPATGNEAYFRTLIRKQAKDEAAAKALLAEFEEQDVSISTDEESFQNIQAIIDRSRLGLLILSSNPMILEQEDFRQLLMSLFHLMDEFHIRGDFQNLSKDAKKHMDDDFTKVFYLLIREYIPNAKYMRETYPNLYAAFRKGCNES